MKKKIIEWLFYWCFKGYVFPFEKLNDKLLAMDEARRRNYFATAKELIENEVLTDIIQEATRKFYQELSVKSSGSIEQAGYRMTLIWINEQFNKKIKELAMQFTTFKPKELPKLDN